MFRWIERRHWHPTNPMVMIVTDLDTHHVYDPEARVALRVLHRFTMPDTADDRLVAECRTTRTHAGCLEAEAYRAVGSPTAVAVTELWQDERAYGTYWRASLTTGDTLLTLDLARTDSADTEFYRQQHFRPDNGIWRVRNSEVEPHPIAWPARGPVRILIQSCFLDTDEEREWTARNDAETQREPGCLEFRWMRGIEDPRHVLLAELWESQQIYDRHWALRLATGSGGNPDRVRAERTFGTNGAEFYRLQEFRHHYDRWLPRHAPEWSSTIEWPS